MISLFDEIDGVSQAGSQPKPKLPYVPVNEGPPGPPKSRPYQLDVIERARARVQAGKRRGIIQGETGGGKTHCGVKFAESATAKKKRTLIIADRRRLIKQWGKELDQFGLDYGVIMSGSTHSINAPILLASRDTLASWIDHPEFALPEVDLVLNDEAHKSMGETYQFLLWKYREAVIIGLTATPARGDGKSLGGFWEWIECMVPASQLIAEGWLIKPEVYAPLELASKRKSGTKTRGLAGDPVNHWRRHAEGLPTIAFSSSVDESLQLRDQFLAAGIRAEHIDGTHDDDEREAAFDRLRAGVTMILCSVKLLIEGVDIPEVSAAILWAPFGSLIEFRQGCGRIMRPAPWAGKTRAVVLDHSGAAGIHGMPGDDIAWSLDMNSTISERHERDPKKPTTHYCKQCGLAFQDRSNCPSCGWRLPREKKQQRPGESIWTARDEVLSRYDGEAGPGPDVVSQARGQHWRRCIATAVNKGAKASMAVALFMKRFNIPPWSAGVFPLPSDRGDWSRPAAEVFPSFVRRGVAS